jgi:predicted metalloprotease with PDZ domain
MVKWAGLAAIGAVGFIGAVRFEVSAPVRYRVMFPEPQHRWMQVEAEFPEIGSSAIELRMSRSSPGRYSLHDFAKNVYDVHVVGADGRELQPTRPDPYGWNVSGHGGTVVVGYKIYGDRVDGTYLAVDPTHAHINMPAAMIWAHGFEDRPIVLTLQQPAGASWRAATQLHAGSTPLEFTAPNLQYFMDSPVEFGQTSIREFTSSGRRFRVALHHTGTDAEFGGFVKDIEKIDREEGAVYGEFPQYEPGYYTFITDYLPWAAGDGMEHRNSTVITSPATLARSERELLGAVAHEFFHGWNVERIRPRGLEPFDFDRANLSGELWLAEGFTQYYGPLALQRAGLDDLSGTAETLSDLIETVSQSAGRQVRTAEQMSQMAPFIDGGRTVDRTNWENTVISYYPFGGAIALAMDLSLRDRSDNRVSLDDYMRAMWRKYGQPSAGREGYVDKPYSIAEAQATLAEVAGDEGFARDFFSRFIQGYDLADYGRLLARAGFTLRKRNAGRAWLGDLKLDFNNGARVASLVSPTWPIYASGIDEDDELQQIDGHRITSESDLAAVLARHKPGDVLSIVFVDRTRAPRTTKVRLAEDPHVEVVPAESSGAISRAQQAFRDGWLKSRS